MKAGNLWDIFCRVIDNYGDIGVCWRLATGLAARGERVRLWVDDSSALNWMAPKGAPGVEIRSWSESIETTNLATSDVLIEAFGCEINPEFIAFYAASKRTSKLKPIWINLEYLSAEKFAERCHQLPSPVMSGPGSGLTKHFFYPGFTTATGGLLREPELAAHQAKFNRTTWLKQLGIEYRDERLISLFCYEPPALGELLDQLATAPQATRLLITSGRATTTVKTCISNKNATKPSWNKNKKLSFSYLPALTQQDFDYLLWSCDLNFVRGEDSLIRALWAGKPFIWQIYPQHDNAHHSKLDAFLNVLNAPPSLRIFHRFWNGINETSHEKLPALTPAIWQQTVTRAQNLQLQHVDLVTQIMQFALKNH